MQEIQRKLAISEIGVKELFFIDGEEVFSWPPEGAPRDVDAFEIYIRSAKMRIKVAEEAMKEHTPKLGEKAWFIIDFNKIDDEEYMRQKLEECYEHHKGKKTMDECKEVIEALRNNDLEVLERHFKDE